MNRVSLWDHAGERRPSGQNTILCSPGADEAEWDPSWLLSRGVVMHHLCLVVAVDI